MLPFQPDGVCPTSAAIVPTFSLTSVNILVRLLSIHPISRSLIACSIFSKEVLIKSAVVDGERFSVKTRFEKWRNTLCISHFSNRSIGEKDPPSAAGDLFRDSLKCCPIFHHLSVKLGLPWISRTNRRAEGSGSCRSAPHRQQP